jgi:hypothetical protein
MFEMVVEFEVVFIAMEFEFIYSRVYETIRIGFLIIISLVVITKTSFNFTR